MKNAITSRGHEQDTGLEELAFEQLDIVIGGALLLPAVQKVREAAASDSDDRPTETFSLNF